MKHIISLLTLFLSCTSLHAQDRVVEQPAFEVRNTNTLEFQKIILNDTATIMYVDAYYRPKYWIKIVDETTLEANGKSYRIKAGDGIKLNEEFWMPESGTASFRLIFPPLPKDTKTVDFIEGNDKGAFKIWGIRLDGKTPSVNFPNVKKPEKELVLEKPELKSGIATLNGKFIGYKPGMDEELPIWVFNILTAGADQNTINVKPDGSFKLEIPLLHISSVVLSGNSVVHTRFYIKPGETTSVEINMPEICRAQSKIQSSKPSLGNKFYFTGALADINNDLANNPVEEPSFSVRSQEEYDQMMKDISTMTVDQYKTYWTEKYQKAVDQLNQLTGISDAHRQLIAMKLKHELADQLLGYRAIEYAYRQTNKIPKDSVLVNYVKPIATQDYFNFLPELLSNDPYFIYNGNAAYLLRGLQFTNFTGKDIKLEKDEKFPDNTADIARIMGTDKGLLFDMLAAQKLAASISEFRPLDEQELAKTNTLNPALKEELIKMNEKLKLTIEENKKKSGYTVNRVNIADIPSEELFNAITTPYRGKVVFVDFWATWCGPCRMAMKETEPVKKEYEGKDVVFLYLAAENSPKGTWEQMIPDIKGEHYRVTAEQWEYWGKKFGINGVPSYMVVAKDGTPVHFQVGFMGVDKMKEMIDKELAK